MSFAKQTSVTAEATKKPQKSQGLNLKIEEFQQRANNGESKETY